MPFAQIFKVLYNNCVRVSLYLELKTVWKIIWRTFVGLFLAVYCLVALANYSLVQSYAAT